MFHIHAHTQGNFAHTRNTNSSSPSQSPFHTVSLRCILVTIHTCLLFTPPSPRVSWSLHLHAHTPPSTVLLTFNFEGKPTNRAALTGVCKPHNQLKGEASGQGPYPRSGGSICLSPPQLPRKDHRVQTDTQLISPFGSQAEMCKQAQGGVCKAGERYEPRKVPQSIILAGQAHLHSEAWTHGHIMLEKVATQTSVSQGPGESPSQAANQGQGADNHKLMPCQ